MAKKKVSKKAASKKVTKKKTVKKTTKKVAGKKATIDTKRSRGVVEIEADEMTTVHEQLCLLNHKMTAFNGFIERIAGHLGVNLEYKTTIVQDPLLGAQEPANTSLFNETASLAANQQLKTTTDLLDNKSNGAAEVTLEDVTQKLQEVGSTKGLDEVKRILNENNAESVSAIKPDLYTKVLEACAHAMGAAQAATKQPTKETSATSIF